MIKVVLFDVDGVLSPNIPFSMHLARDYGITREMTLAFFAGKFLACLEGRADLKVELERYLPQWGWKTAVDEYIAYWFGCEDFIDESLIGVVQLLRQQGVCCYLATNQEKYRTAYILDQMGLAEKFDGMFASADIGYIKPNRAFFEQVLHRLTDVQAQEILFWDDRVENVVSARQVGLQAEVYTNVPNFLQTMSQYFDPELFTLCIE